MCSPLKISVLVPTHGRPVYLLDCLKSLESQTRQPDEVVVVLRADDSDSESALESFKRASSLRIKSAIVTHPGVIAAENAGLREVTGDIVCFTDDDARPLQDWVERIESYFGSKKVGGVGGRVIGHQDGRLTKVKKVRRVGRLQWMGRLVGQFHQDCGAVQSVDFLLGGNMSYRRDSFGRLDENLVGDGYHWEVDLGLSVKKRGYELIYDPRIRVKHFSVSQGRGPSASPRQRFFSDGHNTTYVLLKHLPLARGFLFLVYYLLVGDTDSPGPMKTLHLLCRERSFSPFRYLLAATRGKLRGLITYRRRNSR